MKSARRDIEKHVSSMIDDLCRRSNNIADVTWLLIEIGTTLHIKLELLFNVKENINNNIKLNIKSKWSSSG